MKERNIKSHARQSPVAEKMEFLVFGTVKLILRLTGSYIKTTKPATNPPAITKTSFPMLNLPIAPLLDPLLLEADELGLVELVDRVPADLEVVVPVVVDLVVVVILVVVALTEVVAEVATEVVTLLAEVEVVVEEIVISMGTPRDWQRLAPYCSAASRSSAEQLSW